MEPTKAIPWYKSQIILGVGVSLISKALVASSLIGEVTTADQALLTTALVTLLGAGGDVYALVQRLRQTSAPAITTTKAKAEEKHEALTQEAAETPTWMR